MPSWWHRIPFCFFITIDPFNWQFRCTTLMRRKKMRKRKTACAVPYWRINEWNENRMREGNNVCIVDKWWENVYIYLLNIPIADTQYENARMTHGQYKWYVFAGFKLVRRRGNMAAVRTFFIHYFSVIECAFFRLPSQFYLHSYSSRRHFFIDCTDVTFNRFILYIFSLCRSLFALHFLLTFWSSRLD